jgi:hypothetical protein
MVNLTATFDPHYSHESDPANYEMYIELDPKFRASIWWGASLL